MGHDISARDDSSPVDAMRRGRHSHWLVAGVCAPPRPYWLYGRFALPIRPLLRKPQTFRLRRVYACTHACARTRTYPWTKRRARQASEEHKGRWLVRVTYQTKKNIRRTGGGGDWRADYMRGECLTIDFHATLIYSRVPLSRFSRPRGQFEFLSGWSRLVSLLFSSSLRPPSLSRVTEVSLSSSCLHPPTVPR